MTSGYVELVTIQSDKCIFCGEDVNASTTSECKSTNNRLLPMTDGRKPHAISVREFAAWQEVSVNET